LLEAPYWGPHGAVNLNEQSYVLVDGGNNGMIRATANGTDLAYKASGRDTVGVYSFRGSYNEIRNLTIADIYVHTPNLSDTASGTGAWGIFIWGGSGNSIHHNTIHDCGTGIRFSNITDTGFTAYNNTIYNINWGIIVGDSNLNDALTGTVTVHDNDIHDFALWDQTNNYNHHDGIYFFVTHEGSVFEGGQIYNNFIHGDPGEYMNTMVYVSGSPGKCAAQYIFNNLLVNESRTRNDTPANGLIQDWCDGDYILNNTLIGINQSSTSPVNNSNPGINVSLGTNVTIENDIIQLFRNGIGIGRGASILSIDFNDYYHNRDAAWDNANYSYPTVGNWRQCHAKGCPSGPHDSNSFSKNPNLSNLYIPNPGSPVIAAGMNLTSLGIAALNSDKAGNARPSSGAWTMGAYNPR